MMSFSVILATGTRYILPVVLLFSAFLLIRGHNEPGGGFVGGLAASVGFVLFAVSFGVKRAREVLPVDPRVLIGVGLLVAILSGLLPFVLGMPFLTGMWYPYEIPAIHKIGTPLLFDVGVYLVVIGVVLTIVFSLAEE
jgi:multicomponent Na+:H+ antiporter subunit B